MMVPMLTSSMMVVAVVAVVRADPSSEVVVEGQGERKSSAEDWMAMTRQR